MSETHCVHLKEDDQNADVCLEVIDLAPGDPCISALLALLFPDPRPGVSSTCYPHEPVA